MLHMQIPTINISLQHCCYKSLDNVCPFFAACERKIIVLVLVGRFYCSLFLLDTLENHLYLALFLRGNKDYDVNICIKM